MNSAVSAPVAGSLPDWRDGQVPVAPVEGENPGGDHPPDAEEDRDNLCSVHMYRPPRLGSPLSRLHRDWAHRCHICTGTGLTLPHLHRDWAHACHTCTGTGCTPVTPALGLGLTPVTLAPGLGLTPATPASPAPHVQVTTGAVDAGGSVALVGGQQRGPATTPTDVRHVPVPLRPVFS